MGQLISRISDAHLIALGRVTANFSQLEDELCRLIWYLLSSDQQLGQIVTAELSFKGLINLAGSLARYRTSDITALAETESALKSALKAEEERNILVHSTWFAGHTENDVSRIKLTAKQKHGRKIDFENVAPQAIERVAEQISEAAFSVMQIYAKMQGGALAVTLPLSG